MHCALIWAGLVRQRQEQGNQMPQTALPAADRRYCEDCRYFLTGLIGKSTARCRSQNAPKMSTGDEYVSRDFDQPAFCSSQRLDKGRCGPGAAWFEPILAQAAE